MEQFKVEESIYRLITIKLLQYTMLKQCNLTKDLLLLNGSVSGLKLRILKSATALQDHDLKYTAYYHEFTVLHQ